jgi:hypothetical protein
MRPLVSLSLRSLLCSLTVGVAYLSGQQAQPVAYILNLNGTWQLEGRQEAVKAGQPLSAGSKLFTNWNNHDNFITIMQCDDLSRIRIACDNTPSNPCRNPVVINSISTITPTNRFRTIATTALALLLDKPPPVASHFSATLSRGEYVILEKEDVLMMSDTNQFSVAESFPALPPGRYAVNATKSGTTTPSLSEKIAHLPDGSWQNLHISEPGLYMISILDSDGERRGDVLILFLPGSEYRAAKEKFDAIKAQTSKWNGTSAQADEHLFLRSVLLAMSQPQ